MKHGDVRIFAGFLAIISDMVHYVYFKKNVTLMDMAPMSLKKLFTSFEMSANPATRRLRRMFHDMPRSIIKPQNRY